MDLRGYTTVDEVGEDTQVRNVENFRPTTAAEEIEYLNKILENMENYHGSGENNKSEIPELESPLSENDHSNHTYNNNAIDLITEVCSDIVNVEISKSVCDQNFVREECSGKLEQLNERYTVKENFENEKSHCDEVDIKEYGLPCADDILTQAENQHSVIQDIKSGHVQNELSTEPNLITADPAIPDVEDNVRQSPGCTQSNFSPNAELEEKLEAHSIEPVSSDAPNETGSSELSSSTKEATIMPVNCSAESLSVLESRHYSAKETFDFISGEDVSESSTLDSLELDVSSLSNVVLGDIRSLLESSSDEPNVTAENTPAEYETQIDLSIVKSEPDCTDPGENFDLKDLCSDPGEEFVLNEHSIKEEPLEDSPPAPTMNQEEVLLPVKVFKNEDNGSDEQVVMPNIRYLVDEKKQYSREEVAAALIISQSSLSPIIDMEMFQNLGKTMLTVNSSRLEDMLKSPDQLTLEDFHVVQLFRNNYGSSLHDWKAYFKLRTNYSAKHTAKKKPKEQIDNAPVEKKKGRRGRKKKCETEMGNNDVSIKGEKVKKEEMEHSDYEVKKIHRESTKVFPLKEEGKLERGIKEEASVVKEDSSKETITPKAKKGKRGRKKKRLIEESSVLEHTEVKNENDKENEPRDCILNQTNDEFIQIIPLKDGAEQQNHGMVESEYISDYEAELMIEDASHKRKRKRSLDQIDYTERTQSNAGVSKDENAILKSEYVENEFETDETSQQRNLPIKDCYIHLYDIAKDAIYGMIVRKYLKESSENRVLQHSVEESFKEKSTEYVSSHEDIFSNDSSDESFAGFSPVKQREDSLSLIDEDFVADEAKEDLFSEIERREFSRRDQATEKSLIDAVPIGKKVELSLSKSSENTEVRAKDRKERETKMELSKENKGEDDIKNEVDSQTEKDERRTKKKLKLDSEDLDERRRDFRNRKKSLSEDYVNLDISVENKMEEIMDKEDKFKDGPDMQYAKKSKEVLTTKDRNPATSSLPALSTFRIPKKKVTHIGEPKTQEQNSVLLRRGESSATSKPVGYFSEKQFSARSKKTDFKVKERHNTRHIKNEAKPSFPAQQPVVEGWAKRAPPPPFGRGYHPQPGLPTMPVRTISPSSGTHIGPGYSNKLTETSVNQHRMQFSSHERQHMTAKTDIAKSNIPCSQFGATSSDKPVWSLNVPPPPQLEKLDLSSVLKHDNESIQKTPYESSPVMSYGYSSDGESDITETGKLSSNNRQKTQLPLTSMTDSPNTDLTNIYIANSLTTQPSTKETGSPDVEVTQVNKANVGSAQPPQSNVSGILNLNISETCKADVSSVQSSQPNSTSTLDIATTTKVTNPSSEEVSHKEMDSRVAASKSAELIRDKLEAREGTSKDHYQNLDKRQKIKLYEKRKRYYNDSRRKYYAEKGDKKHFWYKEYEKRKKEYYHLKLYLYKEKKREQMAKFLKKSKNSQDNRVDKATASIVVDSEPCTEPESSKQKESCKSVEDEEIPYSPTGSPIAFDDIDVSKSVVDEPSKITASDIKEQEVNLNYPADKLKETLMQILKAINQESSNVKEVSESHPRNTEVKSKKNESAEANDQLHTSEPTSPCSSPPKISESFLSLKTTESFLSSSSLPLPLKEILLPSSVPSPLLVQVSQPSLSDLQSSHSSSKPLSQDSLTVPFSSTCTPPSPVSAPQSLLGPTTPPLPAPSPQTIPGPTSTPPLPVPPPHSIPDAIATPPLPVPPPWSSNSGKNSSCPNIERKVDLPTSAQLKSFLGGKTHSGIPDVHPLQKSLPKYVALPPLPSSPAPPQSGQESVKETSIDIQDSYLSSVTPGDEAVPPLPPPPLPPLLEKSESYNTKQGGLGEICITDDMTEVPMDIDSDENDNSERYDFHDNNKDYKKIETLDCLDSDEGNDSERCNSHDTLEGKYESLSCQDNTKEKELIETLDCLSNTDYASETGNKDGSEGHESDRDFLALFGIYDNSPALGKEADRESTGDKEITTLVRKLMSVTSTRKPVNDQGNDIGHARVEEISTTSILGRPSSGVHALAHNEKEMKDSGTSKEPILPVSNVDFNEEVSIVPENNTPGMATKEQEADTSLRPCSKEKRKGKSSDGAIDANLKSEIEIIAPKEPPKNLICVDEILLSVKAADQPTDLQIIYADLRKTPREKPNIIRDEVPKYYQKTALAQMLVDKCKDIPLVGLQYVLEVRKDFNNTLDGCYYICAVCSKKMTAHTLVAHIKSMPHRLKFSETHCKHIYDKYSSYDIKEWTAPLVKTFTVDLAEVEKKMGRHKLAVAFEREISLVLKSLKQKISEISSLRQQEEKTKVSEAPTPSTSTTTANSVSDKSRNQNAGAHASSGLNAPSKSQCVEAHAASNINIPLPSKSSGPTTNTSNKNNDGYFENEEDEVLILPQEKKSANTKKFSSNGQGFTKRNYRPGPNFRHRSRSRSSTPSLSPVKTRSRSRSKSRSLSPKRNRLHSPPNKLRKHSKSPPRRKPDRRSPQRRSPQRHSLERPGSDRHHLPGRKRKHSRSPVSPHHSRSRSRSRDIRKRYRSRSRSRSRHRSPHRKRESWARHSPPPKRDSTEEGKRRAIRRRLQEFREAEMKIKARHRNFMVVYEKAPETHPLYNREWKLFWERRCRELEKEGLDPFLYNFKREWAVYWHHRMKELIDKNFKEKRESLLKKFKIEDPDLEESKLYEDSKPPGSLKKRDNDGVEKVSRIDRSPSPWEEDGPVIGRNPSPTPEEIMNTAEGNCSSKSKESSAAKFEDDFSVIGTLKLLNELEDQLGSFGPAITTLLGKAVDCSQKGEDTLELFNDPDNLVLVRYAREKLSSQISAGILGVAALVKTQMAVERSMWLQSQAEKLANEGKYLGLDIAGIAKATLGRDTVQIAQYIAQHLLQVGKSNASETDLQSILYAVLAAHTKLLVETSKKSQVDTPVTEGITPVSTPCMPALSDPPKEFPVAPSETPVNAKQPLFPSSVPDKSPDVDSMEGDKGSLSKLSGGLEFLQNSYDDENGKEMENLSLDDLRSLLSNFNSLSTEEKQALTAYLKKLEATDSKKVTKLREEIQKSARNTPKASNVKVGSKSGKSSARPQGTTHIDSNSQLGQQQSSGALQMSTPEGKVPPTKTGGNMRPHSKDSASQPPLASPLEKNFMVNSKEGAGKQGSRGIAGQDPTCNIPPTISGVRNIPPSHSMLPSNLEPPSQNLPPTLGRICEMAQDFEPGVLKSDRMDQPVFDKGHNHPFPQQTFMDRQGPGSDREMLLSHNNQMGPDGPDRCDRQDDARFDRLGKARFDRPGEPRFDGPGEPRFGGPGEQWFGRPGEQRFDGPGEPRFDRPSEARFDRPKGPNFNRTGEERFGGPGEPRFGGPGERGFSGPVEARYDMPGPSRSDGPRGFNGPDGPGRLEFDRHGDSRFGRPGEPYNSQWDGFGRGGPPVDDCAFPPQNEWYDKGSQGPHEGPRGRGRGGWSGRPFRGMPGRGLHSNTRQPYREPW